MQKHSYQIKAYEHYSFFCFITKRTIWFYIFHSFLSFQKKLQKNFRMVWTSLIYPTLQALKNSGFYSICYSFYAMAYSYLWGFNFFCVQAWAKSFRLYSKVAKAPYIHNKFVVLLLSLPFSITCKKLNICS